jgi:hypothetical protein
MNPTRTYVQYEFTNRTKYVWAKTMRPEMKLALLVETLIEALEVTTYDVNAKRAHLVAA